MEKKNIFRKNLAHRRKELGLTQEQLAQRMNVSPQAVSKWENTSYPDAELLPKLAKVLNISLDTLFGIRSNITGVNLEQLVHDAVHNAPIEKRSQIIMQLCYSILCAHDPNCNQAKKLCNKFERETFAGLNNDDAISLARLNSDLRYFFYMEKPEEGVNHYFTDSKNMARLLNTLADEEAIRIISYLGSGVRNKIYSVAVISQKLGIVQEKVQYVIDRLDRLGIVWRIAADIDDEPVILYGYTHSQPVAMILVLAQSLCGYMEFWDTVQEDFSVGMFSDETVHNPEPIPEVSCWDDDN